jgi:hypothetical protein
MQKDMISQVVCAKLGIIMGFIYGYYSTHPHPAGIITQLAPLYQFPLPHRIAKPLLKASSKPKEREREKLSYS